MTMRTKHNLLDLYPLTPLQQGILFHALASDRDDPYLVRLCFRLDGAVDADALRRAWQTVADRHEALRADLEWVKSKQPIELVFRHCPVTLDQLDWRDVPPGELEARLQTLSNDEAGRYSLARAADQRVVLIRTGAARSFLVWIFHHVLLDGWSLANVLGEVLTAYRAHVDGTAPDLAAIPPYARYLAWLRAQEAPPAEAYWRTVLADHEPAAFPPTTKTDHHGFAERSVTFDDAHAAQLRALARTAQVTLSTCFHAALALLIKTYTSVDDVIFGATVAGRPAELAGASSMVGAFINTVPVRVRLRGRDAVIPWLQQLHRDGGQRRAFEHLGLPRIQELAQLPAATPLFESILVFENFPVTEVLEQADALPFAVEPHRRSGEPDGLVVGRGRNNYPLSVVVLPGRRIELILAYHRERITDATASAMLARLAAIVGALAGATANTRLAGLGDAPRATTAAPTPIPGPDVAFQAIHDRIARWASITPDALAVRCEADALTYAELDARAHQLAHALRDRGVAPGVRVGLCLPRSIDFVVALCATLRCGAAYVPVEPDHPRARLAELFDDAQLAAVITRRSLRPTLDRLHATVLCCDDLPSTADVVRVDTTIHPETPAYLIYTSGSTGRPKGVVVSHRALDHYVIGILARLALPAHPSMAMVSTVAADLGHTALFGALCAGGTLHLITDERAGDPDGFADYMTRHQIAALKIVPGHLWGLMQIAEPDRALPVHTLIIGGEVAPPPLLAYLRRQPRCRVVNHYGPTETTVGILTHALALAGDPPADTAPVPLGRPLPHSRAYVLGADLAPMPPGATGEIYLAGRGLSAGYFRRGPLTAERFVPDVVSGEPGARMYRTGDRGRVRDDGAIEFLGRADDQIKLRGFRIELGEIRAELLRLPAISDARVVVRPGPAGAPQLCAYLVGTVGLDRPAVEAQLRARLPEPMIPSAWVWLDRFPVTANGKVDLARLPAPASPGTDDEPTPHAPRAPATEVERALAAIWQDILGCPHVQLDDNFFQLGGDSILALKVVARARRAGFKLTPKQLNGHPTLAEAASVAVALSAEPAAPITRSTATNAPPPIEAPVRLTPIQLRFLERQQLDPHHYNQAILLELTSPLDLDVLERAMIRLTRHHDALRLRFRREGDGWRAGYADASAPVTGTVTRVDLRTAVDPADAIDRACDELQRSFDLAHGPLLRAAYLDLGPDLAARLLLFAHHLVVDGVSWRILLEDLADLVRDPGNEAALSPSTPFQTWTERLHHHSTTAALRDQLAYWQHVVAAVPGDRDQLPARSNANIVGDAAILSTELDERTTAGLLTRAPRAYTTQVNDLLLAALGLALCRRDRRPSVLVTVEGHGREDLFEGVDLSRTVGWFSTTYPVRLVPAPGDRASTIRAVRDQLRAIPDHGLGYDVLRSLAGAALPAGDPTITFNYLGQFDQSFAGQQLFRVAAETSGRRRSPHTPRDSHFVVNAVVYDGALRIDWEYSRALHDRDTAAALLVDYLTELRGLIAHCEAVAGAAP
jgi:amino acid adenylation domain-containing protein/non-ribosomal peptide synthase protein (TIGR01720 family)